MCGNVLPRNAAAFVTTLIVSYMRILFLFIYTSSKIITNTNTNNLVTSRGGQ